MDTFSTQLMIKALDSLSARANITAENIANAGSRNYRPQRLSFETELAAAAAHGPEAVQSFEPNITRLHVSDGQVRLDLELATASSTALRYAALIDLLNRQMQIEALAIKGNG